MTLSRLNIALSILLAFNWVIDLSTLLVSSHVIDDYWTKRANFIREEESLSFGGDFHLQKNEFFANRTLMLAKFQEIDEGFKDQNKFLPQANFITVKKQIENSEVYKIIKKLPKGAVLHAHDVGILSPNYVLNNVTYRENLYACEEKGLLKLMFFKNPDQTCEWKLLSELRQNQAKEIEINIEIKRKMSMITENPSKAYSNSDKAWIKFQSIFEFIFPFLTYKPVFEDYYYQCLQEFYDDKVLYVELRSVLPDLYDLNGQVYSNSEVMQIMKDITDRFTKKNPDFIGVKIIYAPLRFVNSNQLKEYLEIARQLKDNFPSFFAGFDLVGHEDKGGLLSDFADLLQTYGKEMPFFFHAGETDWYGLSTDQNLIDAVLLNAKRIGHGYALLKHPKVMELVRKNKIAIEVNPISNQVLSLVDDLRNHPASVLFAEDYPVVVSCDDPGLWGAKGLSYDFYEAFMGIMSRNSDLRALKKLALNSISYSTMSSQDQSRAFAIFEQQWQIFLQETESDYIHETIRETDWYGLSTDQNLIDAVLLNAKRIGHGFALLKHPKVMELARKNKIATEVNPIFNQVLSLGLWGAKGLSYDFYKAFMGIMSRNSDLRALKKLALNSISYSTMSSQDQSRAFAIFEQQWQIFLQETESDYIHETIRNNNVSEL